MTSRSSRREPRIPDPVDVAVDFWRWLRRMRTALYLLGALAAAVLVGTLVPQRPNVPATVGRWMTGEEGPGRSVARVLDTAGLFDVFGAPWFLVLVALLFTSLTACLIPRYRAYWRMWRRGRAPRSRNLDAHSHTARFASDAAPREVLTGAREILQRRSYRLRADVDAGTGVALASDMSGVVVDAPAHEDDAGAARPADGDQVAGEKGHLAREGGSLLFHTAFYLLLIGVVLGELTSFVGQVGVVEGETFTDTPVAYWSRDAGRLWEADDHPGFEMTLDHFDVDWTAEGQPVGFRSFLTVDPGEGRDPYAATTFVNVPLVVDGMKIHQLDWGYATRIVVRDADGQAVFDEWMTLNGTDANIWEGAVKAPALEPQLGLELNLIPTAVEEDGGLRVTHWPGAEAPLLVFTAWVGDLRLDRVQNVNTLDTTALRELSQGALRPGQRTQLSTGATVEFTELRRWAGFQVSRRPTVPLLLAAAALLLAGLVPALYAYRRRIWVVATTRADGRTLVTVAGQAFQRPHAFEGEFADTESDLVERLASRPGREAPGQPDGVAGGVRRDSADDTDSQVVPR